MCSHTLQLYRNHDCHVPLLYPHSQSSAQVMEGTHSLFTNRPDILIARARKTAQWILENQGWGTEQDGRKALGVQLSGVGGVGMGGVLFNLK